MSLVSQYKNETIAFAGSGGLDSMTIVKWLSEQGVRVICYTADFGQPDESDLGAVKDRMLAAGAEAVEVIDLKERLANAGLEVIKSQAYHRGRYWNTTGAARHVLVKGMLEKMRERGIRVLSHGCTGRGNDQVRFQHITNLLEPGFEIYAPWRDPTFLNQFRGRTEMIAYCESKGLPLKAKAEVIYSTDANMLGLTHEAGILESITTPARTVKPTMGVYPMEAPDRPESVTVHFKKGIPVGLNGKQLGPVEMILQANEIAGKQGIGLGVHLVEDRIIGIKSRGVYEAPGLELLGTCHEFLSQLILDETAHGLYSSLSRLVADQIYRGHWFDQASAAAGAGIDSLMVDGNGDITVSLYKGTLSFEKAENVAASLYSRDNASMEAIGEFNHTDSEGYLKATGQAIKAAGINKVVNRALLQRI
ncbi:MAG: argininosuccinate synthase [Gammaproteobacteria bacterium]